MLFMLGTLGSLVRVALSVDSAPLTLVEFWLLSAPFAVHLGWILCAGAVNSDILADAHKAAPEAMLGIAILSVVANLLLAALVAAWALVAFSSELAEADGIVCLMPTRRAAALCSETGVVASIGGSATAVSPASARTTRARHGPYRARTRGRKEADRRSARALASAVEVLNAREVPAAADGHMMNSAASAEEEEAEEEEQH